MPSRKGFEQATAWLRNKIAEKDTMDAVNAELCLNVMMDLKKRKEAIGAIYHQTKVAKERKEEELERLEYEREYERDYTARRMIELPEEWAED